MRLPPWLWRICRSKWTKRFLIASPFLLMISVVAFYGVANWYGTWTLKREAAAMKAAGWPVTREEVLGSSSADEDLFLHPSVVHELSLSEKQQLRPVSTMVYAGSLKGFSAKSEWAAKPDLARLSDVKLFADPARPYDPEALVALDLLAKLQPHAERFDELKAAFGRSSVGWKEEPGGQLMPLKNWSVFATQRAKLHLAAANPSAAFADLETAAILAEHLERGPFLLSFLIAVLSDEALQVAVWEGIKRQAWTDKQLARFQQRFQQAGGARNFRRIIRSELAFGMEHALTRFDEYREEPDWDSVVTSLWEGTRHWDRVQIKEAITQSWNNVRPQGLRKLDVRDAFAAFRATGDWLVERPDSKTTEEFRTYLEGPKRGEVDSLPYHRVTERYFAMEAKRVLAITGIALERYRLKHGMIPQKLESLVPEFLPEVPKDISDGQPLRYQVLPDGSPHVWSIWPSGKDEGGMPNHYDTRNTVWTTGQIPGLTEAVYKTR